MAKQIKVGFDKIPSPELNQFVPLYDLASGTPLTDISGRIIVTQEPGLLDIFTLSDNATSIHVNNEPDKQNVGIVEQFPIESEVSTTLLGVPRAEEQLSLFSDVSTYGIDDKDWEYYTVTDGPASQLEWDTRRHPFYGRRKNVVFREFTNEQALALEAFPVNYSYPFGPRFTQSYFNDARFKQYINFVIIGKALHSYFSSRGYQGFADLAFLTDRINVVNSAYNPIVIDETSIDAGGFILVANAYDITYGNDLDTAYAEIERFTLNYRKILDREFTTPFEAFYNTDIFKGISRLSDQTRPGYSDARFHYGVLETKTEFRYQPGRISGFTYGIRLRNDPNSTSSFIEFGCVNDTDQYLFRIEGSRFSIVRRSEISLLLSNPALQARLGFSPQDEVLKYPPGINNPYPLYELEIPRERWNGDSLDGNGPSGYILSLEDVTMFKIEFGWYGAIGAKFYAYVPTGNDGARWVLMHTLVIENGLGEPCLVNPNFRFRYALGVNNTSEIVEPIYVYKYGSSYYIDGGDEGTLRINSKTSDTKTFTAGSPVMGVIPKNVIMNSDGIEITNRMKLYPATASVNTDTAARVDVREIIGSPEGHHFHYSPSLKQTEIGDKGRTVEFRVSADRSQITLTSGQFTNADRGAKLVGDGIYNAYVGTIDSGDPATAKIERRSGGDSSSAYNKAERALTDLVRKSTGEELDPAEQTFTARLSNYDTIVASEVPITTDYFKIHFLNPTPRDAFSHYADIAFCVTSKKPSLVFNEETELQELKFGPTGSEEYFNIFDPTTTYVEWTHRSEGRSSLTGAESGEGEFTQGTRFDLDFRLPRPLGTDSGVISGIVGRVERTRHVVTDVQPDSETGFQRLYFNSLGATPNVPEESLGIAEIGIRNASTGITIESQPLSEVLDGITYYYILVNGDVESVTGYNGIIQLKRILLTDNFRLISRLENGELRFQYKQVQVTSVQAFNVQPLYLVIGLKDRANVHNIVVEEITKQTTFTHTPLWITNSDEGNLIVNSGGSTQANAPSNFLDTGRLSSARFDTQTQQPLRPGNTIYSFFVGENSSELLDLSSIFGPDRRIIRPGTLNNLGTFFVASPIEGLVGNIEASLTLKEQI